MMTAVIIDDVAEARNTLAADLASYCPELEIIGEADGVVKGAKLIREKKPQIVFLDIQMPDGSGFDLLEIFGEINFGVIFTTASDAYAIQAFRFSAIDYLLKPIDPDDLLTAVEKARKSLGSQQERLDLLLDNVKEKKPMNRLALNTLEKIHVVHLSEIIRCESSTNYTIFYFKGGRQLLVTKTLKEFDGMLSDSGFMRVHQSHLVNTEYIREFVKIDGGYIVMADDSNVPVSSRKKSQVMQQISEL